MTPNGFVGALLAGAWALVFVALLYGRLEIVCLAVMVLFVARRTVALFEAVGI